MSFEILGLEKDTLSTLKERREAATSKELTGIVMDSSNPCNRFIQRNDQKYDLRRPFDFFPKLPSKTDRHKMSSIPRACNTIYF